MSWRKGYQIEFLAVLRIRREESKGPIRSGRNRFERLIKRYCTKRGGERRMLSFISQGRLARQEKRQTKRFLQDILRYNTTWHNEQPSRSGSVGMMLVKVRGLILTNCRARNHYGCLWHLRGLSQTPVQNYGKQRLASWNLSDLSSNPRLRSKRPSLQADVNLRAIFTSRCKFEGHVWWMTADGAMPKFVAIGSICLKTSSSFMDFFSTPTLKVSRITSMRLDKIIQGGSHGADTARELLAGSIERIGRLLSSSSSYRPPSFTFSMSVVMVFCNSVAGEQRR